ncbi:MAG: formyltransferase family protein [Planctomycetota bacterium]
MSESPHLHLDVLVSDPAHPVVATMAGWVEANSGAHRCRLIHDVEDARGGDALFLVSCSQIVDEAVRGRYRHTLVLHASDLPQGRGWSPHIWAIVGGAEAVTLCLLEARDPVDSGDVWRRKQVPIDPGWLHDEINAALFAAEAELMSDWIAMDAAGARPVPQAVVGGSYLRRRTPKDSELDPERSIAEQFNLLRVADPVRFPAYVRLHGRNYRVALERLPNERGER